MSIIISNMSIPPGCQKCKFFKKHLFGNGLDYSYSCILGAKDFPMPWIRQMEERASDCPIEPLKQEPVLDKIRAEIEEHAKINQHLNTDRARTLCWCLDVIDKHKTESEGENDRDNN